VPKKQGSQVDRADEESQEKIKKQQEEVKNFEPYTFTNLFDDTHSLEKENHPGNPYLLPEEGAIGAYRPEGEKKRYGGNITTYGEK